MYPLAILIGGPTASGKTELAFEISNFLPALIINADSMQVYKDLKIITNRPSSEKLKKFSCRLFGYLEYPEFSSVGSWKKKVEEILKNEKNKIPIFVGGTGLYLDSLISDISPIPEVPDKIKKKVREIHKKLGNEFFYKKLKKIDKKYSKQIDPNDSQRLVRSMEVKISTGKVLSEWHKLEQRKIFKKILYIVIKQERKILYEKINQRCMTMIKAGVINEVKKFLKKNIKKNHPIYKSIGLRTFEKYIVGKLSLSETIFLFSQESRRYAKRQITWFNNKSKFSKQLSYDKAKEFILQNIK